MNKGEEGTLADGGGEANGDGDAADSADPSAGRLDLTAVLGPAPNSFPPYMGLETELPPPLPPLPATGHTNATNLARRTTQGALSIRLGRRMDGTLIATIGDADFPLRSDIDVGAAAKAIEHKLPAHWLFPDASLCDNPWFAEMCATIESTNTKTDWDVVNAFLAHRVEYDCISCQGRVTFNAAVEAWQCTVCRHMHVPAPSEPDRSLDSATVPSRLADHVRNRFDGREYFISTAKNMKVWETIVFDHRNLMKAALRRGIKYYVFVPAAFVAADANAGSELRRLHNDVAARVANESPQAWAMTNAQIAEAQRDAIHWA
jgi:ribosomal protein L37AE/L43A